MSSSESDGGKELVVAIIDAVCNREDATRDALPPLHQTLDVDALDKLVSSSDESEITVSFSYSESQVSITNGVVNVSPHDEITPEE